jgi:D-3-phosphoglycerate dehydrogenase
MNKILTSPSSMGQISSAPFDLLEEHGYEYINNPYGRKLTEEEVILLAKDCIGIVAGVEPLTPYVMDNLPHLKCISRVGVGLDSVDLEYAKEKGILVTYTPDGPTRAVAELTVGMTLALLRRIPQAHRDMRNHKWGKQIGNLLFGKRIGVLGLGRIGRLVSEMFRGLGNPVIGFDPYADASWAKENGVDLVDFEELIKNADILTIHVPPSGSPIIGKSEFSLMKESAFLINISRGGIVDEEALLEALVAKTLRGAAIDVFEKEPYSGSLCDLENVVLTPHLGSYAEEGKLKMEVDAVQNLIDVLKNV